MPVFTFEDSEPKSFELLKPGKYRGNVAECSFEISNGPSTRGSDVMKITIDFVHGDGVVPVREQLIFHPSCVWKLDLFAKAFNLLIDGKPPVKGQAIDWSEIIVIGLQGWVMIGPSTPKPGGNGKTYNEIRSYLADEPKLPKLEMQRIEQAEQGPDDLTAFQ